MIVYLTILVLLVFVCIQKTFLSACIPLSLLNLSLVALHTYKYQQADRQVPGTQAVSHTLRHTHTDCKHSLRGREALCKHSKLLLSSLLRWLLNNSRPERLSADVCVSVCFLQTVWVKSNYQGHSINIPAVWQVTAESFQAVGPQHPNKGCRWRCIDAERRSRGGVLTNTRPFLRNS